MKVAIAYCIAGLSTCSLVLLWFVNARKVLGQKRDAVYKAKEEWLLHQNGYQKKRGSPEESTAKHMLETSAQIYQQIKQAYQKTFQNPVYWLPGVMMGFQDIIE